MAGSIRSAWEPVTPRGVAAFAHAKWPRLFLVQFLVALLVAGTVAWLLHDGFFPTVSAALEQLPADGDIRSARLNWPGPSSQLLAAGRHVSFAVDLEHSGEVRSLAHFQIEFGRTNVLVRSLLGYMSGPYPDDWIIQFNRTELVPRWGAWRPVWLVAVMVGGVVYLLASWWLLATLYCGPVWLLGYYANRELDLRASWRLAAAALLPGALAMQVAILFHVLGVLDLVHLGFVFALHVVIGWSYLGVSLLFIPRLTGVAAARNPFGRRQR